MLDWIFGKLLGAGVSKFYAVAVLILIYPVNKAGFYIRQGLVFYDDYHEGITDLGNKGLSLSTIPPDSRAKFQRVNRKAYLMVWGASLFLIAVVSVLLINTTWILAGIALLAAFLGYFDAREKI